MDVVFLNHHHAFRSVDEDHEMTCVGDDHETRVDDDHVGDALDDPYDTLDGDEHVP